jgi:hypothetical protein
LAEPASKAWPLKGQIIRQYIEKRCVWRSSDGYRSPVHVKLKLIRHAFLPFALMLPPRRSRTENTTQMDSFSSQSILASFASAESILGSALALGDGNAVRQRIAARPVLLRYGLVDDRHVGRSAIVLIREGTTADDGDLEGAEISRRDGGEPAPSVKRSLERAALDDERQSQSPRLWRSEQTAGHGELAAVAPRQDHAAVRDWCA